MPRDPLYRQILDRLEGTLDPLLFQACAVDLLRAEWPTMVPIGGSADGGMDGAIADGEGVPFPLVSTTGNDAIGNLRKNLKSYRKRQDARDKVVFATSQRLTDRRRQNLEKAARDLGFTLVQTYDRGAIADRLYRKPRWCRDLLGLTGHPPPLSIIPPGTRPLIGNSAIGRDDDLKWLQETPGDLVLSGQPGSGKTFLLYLYGKQHNGLFLVSDDCDRIADGIRSQDPEHVIFDDAHVNRDLLRRLVHLRTEIGATFRIIATSWASEAKLVHESLSLPQSSTRQLQLLTQDQIVEVVKAAGVAGPNRLVRELVDQAEGRPGLAVWLSYLCLRGDVQNVVLGCALAQSVRSTFEGKLRPGWIDFLAGFAIAGDSGMKLADVAAGLGKPPTEVREGVTQLAAAGIVREVADSRLSVRPDTLRHALVRDVFFTGATRLDFSPFVQRAPNIADVASTLVGARGHGADVPIDLLKSFLERANDSDAWLGYAWLGKEECEDALRTHPDVVVKLARPGLCFAPEMAIPLLLERAIGDDRPLGQHPSHPLRLLTKWTQDIRPESIGPSSRRRTVLCAAKRWLEFGHDAAVGIKAVAIALSPSIMFTESDPGSGNKITITRGIVPLTELDQVAALWPTARDAIAKCPVDFWHPVRECIESWAYPSSNVRGVPEPSSKRMVEVARAMVGDVMGLAPEHHGILYWARALSEDIALGVELRLDPELDAVFPLEHRKDFRKTYRLHAERVRKLAETWATCDPVAKATQLKRMVRELAFPGHVWPNHMNLLCENLANCVGSPVLWGAAFLEEGLEARFVEPFLAKATEIEECGHEDLCNTCLNGEQYRLSSAVVVLRQVSPKAHLLDKALSSLRGGADIIETECLRKTIPERNLTLLLQHQDPEIAGAAAVGEWESDPRGSIRDDLRDAWRRAILKYTAKDYWIAEVLKGDGELAEQWLTARLQPDSEPAWLADEVLDAAVGALDRQAKLRVLNTLPRAYLAGQLVGALVGDDLELFDTLLGLSQLEMFHLYPLEGLAGEQWVQKAKKGLGYGYSHLEIAMAAFPKIQSWHGKASDMHAAWVQDFEQLRSHADDDIRRIAEEGLARAKASYEDALRREHEEAVYGRG